MTKSALLTSTAVALFLGLAPANAQMQQKEEKSAPSQMQQERSQQEKGPSSSQGTQAQESQGKASKESAEKAEPKEKATKGSAQKNTEPKEKSTKGTASSPASPDRQARGLPSGQIKGFGLAEKQSQPQDRKGTAEEHRAAKDNATKRIGWTRGTIRRQGCWGRTVCSPAFQLTEEKRTGIRRQS
jgi:hypothetical protein